MIGRAKSPTVERSKVALYLYTDSFSINSTPGLCLCQKVQVILARVLNKS
jgi:hypothetical protein